MGGGGSSETTTESSPWAPSIKHGENSLAWAEQILLSKAGQNAPEMGTLTPNSSLISAWQNMSNNDQLSQLSGQLGTAGSQLMGGMGQLDSIYKQLGEGMNRVNITEGRDAYLADKEDYLAAQDASILASLDEAIATSSGQIYGNAAGAGNVGSSRTQLAQGMASGNLATAANAQMMDRRSAAYDQAMSQANLEEQQRLASLQAQASGITSAGQLGASMLGQQAGIQQQMMNNQLTAGSGQLALDQQNQLINYQNALNQYNQPMNMLGWYSNLAQGWGGMGGTTTSSVQDTTSSFDKLVNVGVGLGSAYLMSDKRLKKDIKLVGKDKDSGLNVYTWEWNEKASDFPLEARNYNMGYIAQEVQEVFPEAVLELDNGYLMVDYSKVGNKNE